jgi:DNA-binding CsgD family transcriptional regulator
MPTFRRFAAIPGRLVTRSREQLSGDREWYASAEYNEGFRPVGQDDFVACHARADGGAALVGGQVFRPVGEPRFTARTRRLVRLLHGELARYIGPVLARPSADPLAGLAPRLRQTLECLLEGDGEKQVAVRLGLSRATVHEYVTALYRRFDVHSRAELLALLLRRRPSGPPPQPPDGAS